MNLVGRLKYFVRLAVRRGELRFLTRASLAVWTLIRWTGDWFRLRRFDPDSVPQEATLAEWMNYVYESHGGVFRPLQSRYELRHLAEHIETLCAKNVLEIGTARGGTFCILAQSAMDDARLISVDLPGGIGGAGYPRWKIPIFRQLAKRTQSLHFCQGDSHSEEIRRQVADILGGEMLDVVVIDGDHSYPGAKSDYEHFGQFVRPGGLICFHDIVPNANNPAVEVDRLWREISPLESTKEIIDPANLGQFGIGVITRR